MDEKKSKVNVVQGSAYRYDRTAARLAAEQVIANEMVEKGLPRKAFTYTIQDMLGGYSWTVTWNTKE